MRIYGKTAWGGIVIFGSLLLYIAAFLPLWFRKPNPVIFLPVTHIATAAYLAYLCAYSHGKWFLTFALPVTAMIMLVTTAFTVLMKYVRGGRYYIFGGTFLLIGGVLILAEMFEHITFGTMMFVWSPYACGACTAVGIVLILAGIIRPMRDFFNRLFFF